MKYYILDCFAQQAYQGNQLLTVIADRKLSDEEQLQIAKEINFNESSFILSGKKENGGYDVRIWTPYGEVPFAGHPTLGTAYVIWKYLENEKCPEVKLNLKAGQIPVKISTDELVMSQNPPVFSACASKEVIAEVFGIDAEKIRDDYPVEMASTGLPSVIVLLKDRKTLAEIDINKEAFARYIQAYPVFNGTYLFFADMGIQRLAVRCLSEDGKEDAATGSANGNLAGYLLRHDYYHSSDIRYIVDQGEDMGRPSRLNVHASYKDGQWTIEVGGKCHVIAAGEWY